MRTSIRILLILASVAVSGCREREAAPAGDADISGIDALDPSEVTRPTLPATGMVRIRPGDQRR